MYSLFGKGGEGRELLWDVESDLSSSSFELVLFEILVYYKTFSAIFCVTVLKSNKL